MSAATIPHVWRRRWLHDEAHGGDYFVWVRHKVEKQTEHFAYVAQVGEDDDGTNYPLFTRQQPPMRIKTDDLFDKGYSYAGNCEVRLEPDLRGWTVFSGEIEL